MEEHIQARLRQVNHEFYDRFASAFAATRAGVQPGWERIIPHLWPGCQVLDLGCGNGRLARFLDERMETIHYTGVDASAGLIALAQELASGLERLRPTFLVADLAAPGWVENAGWERFDIVTCLAMLHHVPGAEARRGLLQASADCLRHGGVLIVSTWRFTHNVRMQRKIVPWEAMDLASSDVDPGDYLLDWRREGAGLRYVHEMAADEVAELAQQVGLALSEQYLSDGKEGDLSLYSVLVKP